MQPALKAALSRFRALLLAATAGGAASVMGLGQAAVGPDAPIVTAADQESWTAAQAARTPEAYQRYLELFPTGAFAEEAFRLLIERSFDRQPVDQVVDIEPPLFPWGPERQRVVAAAALSLY